MTWPTPYEVPVPDDTLPCRFCGKRCMYAEAVEDWDGRGEVIRIGCGCEAMTAFPKDSDEDWLTRTSGFDLPCGAVAEWNEMQTEEINEEHPDFPKVLWAACKQVGEEARRKAFAAGLPVTILRDGKLIEQYADGSERVIGDA